VRSVLRAAPPLVIVLDRALRVQRRRLPLMHSAYRRRNFRRPNAASSMALCGPGLKKSQPIRSLDHAPGLLLAVQAQFGQQSVPVGQPCRPATWARRRQCIWRPNDRPFFSDLLRAMEIFAIESDRTSGTWPLSGQSCNRLNRQLLAEF